MQCQGPALRHSSARDKWDPGGGSVLPLASVGKYLLSLIPF